MYNKSIKEQGHPGHQKRGISVCNIPTPMYTDAAISLREFHLSKPADIEHLCTIALVTDGLKQTLSTPYNSIYTSDHLLTLSNVKKNPERSLPQAPAS